MTITKKTFFQSCYQPTEFQQQIKDLVWQVDAQEAEHVLRTANDVIKRSFLFDMEHDMERTHEPVVFGEQIDWEFMPKDDREFTWQFNRHRFLICLAQAYFLTGNEEYVTAYIEIVSDFMRTQANPTDKRQTSWRILEIGIRSGNWLKSFYLLKDSPQVTDELVAEMYQFLLKHGEIIFEEHIPYCYAGNWGVLENHGLFLLGTLLPQNETTQKFQKHALEVLYQAMKIQILPDGVQIEQSPMYHNEVLRCMLEVILFSKYTNIDNDSEFLNTIHKMAVATRYLLKPNGTELASGDSDAMNMRPILQLAATVFNDPTLKFLPNEDLNFDNVWLLLPQGRNKFVSLPYQEPAQKSMALWDSGHYVLRSSWQENADFLHFDCGSIGTSHGHSDLFHIDWVVNGRNILVDPGRYTYVDKAERYQFKDLKAHNTFIVDEVQPHKWGGSFHSHTGTSQMKSPFLMKNGYSFIEAGHTAFMGLENPVWVTRRILELSPELHLIIDDAYTTGMHNYKQFFHFDKELSLRLENHKVTCLNGDTHPAVLFDERMSLHLLDTEQADFYNDKVPNKTVQCNFDGKGNQSFYTLLLKSNEKDTSMCRKHVTLKGNQNPFPRDMVEGVHIRHGEEEYRIIVGKVEMANVVDLYDFEGYLGCGKVIVFGPNDSQIGGTVLSW